MKKHLPIGKAAEYLGVSEQTLRRWDKDGIFKATYVSGGSHRYYSLADLEKRAKGLFRIAVDWVSATEPREPAEDFFCSNSETFKTRLERMAREMDERRTLKALAPLVTSIASEIGNNSFDHNIGNWPDVRGAFFGYDLGKRIVALADRGRGILTTLRAVKPELKDDVEALRVAFMESLSGRAPEHRGNGLKYVALVVAQYGFRLRFKSGLAELEMKNKKGSPLISMTTNAIHGCLALLEF